MDDRCELYGDDWIKNYSDTMGLPPEKLGPGLRGVGRAYKFDRAFIMTNPPEKDKPSIERYFLAHPEKWREVVARQAGGGVRTGSVARRAPRRVSYVAMSLTFLCLASYFKGNRFLERLKAEGCTVYLLTVESALGEPWARHACDDVFAVKNFHDRRALVNAVAFLMRSRKIDRIVALDDFDVEVAAFLREHFRMTDTGHGDSQARLFRDKLAMRTKAREIGVRIPDFCPLFNDDDGARVPGPRARAVAHQAALGGVRRRHSQAAHAR